jgi:5-methylcytosine-specific restriction endonuclease McrA
LSRRLDKLIELQDGRCFYCGRPHHLMTIDHVLPLSRGGDDTPANVRLAHRLCNVRKGPRLHLPEARP